MTDIRLGPPGTTAHQARSETGCVQLAAKPELPRTEHLYICQLSGPAALKSGTTGTEDVITLPQTLGSKTLFHKSDQD